VDEVKLTKLPKWAQETIQNLERRVEDQRLAFKDFAQNGNPDSPVEVETGWNQPNFKLPANAEVKFTLDDENEVSFRIKTSNGKSFIYVYALPRGSKYQLTFQPSCSNTAHLGFTEPLER
jgi:hypothetical protein